MKKPYRNPTPGDIVEIVFNGKIEKGVLLESHDIGVLLLKLNNGYNIGFKKEDISEIKIIQKINSGRPSNKLQQGNME